MISILIYILFASNNCCSSGMILQLFFYLYFISRNAFRFYFCSLSATLNLCANYTWQKINGNNFKQNLTDTIQTVAFNIGKI